MALPIGALGCRALLLHGSPGTDEAGVAPVTYASGKHKAVTFRWACNHRLRRALTTLADNSRHASAWAAAIYANARSRGCDHPHAVRILSRAWLRVIWRAWIDRKPYDPAATAGFKPCSKRRGVDTGCLIRLTPDASLNRWLLEEVLPAAPGMPGLGSAHLLQGVQAAAMTHEQRICGADRGVDSAIIVTGYDSNAVAACAQERWPWAVCRSGVPVNALAPGIDWALGWRIPKSTSTPEPSRHRNGTGKALGSHGDHFQRPRAAHSSAELSKSGVSL